MKILTKDSFDTLNVFYVIFSWLVFIWAIYTVCLLAFVSFKFGHLPVYGVDPDPTASNFLRYTLASTFLLIPTLLGIVGTPFFFIPLLIARKHNKGFSLKPLVLYLIGTIIFFTMEITMEPQSLWILD